MKKIEIIRLLEKYPLFTFNEFVRLIKKSPEYARTYLYRLRKENLIFRIERGKYTVFDDPIIFSSHIIVPSYISFWTALRLYNLTEQLPTTVMIASPNPKKAISFQDTKIQFFKTNNIWGYKKQRHGNFDIFIAEKEKCIIDCLLLKNTPFDEVMKAIKTGDLDTEKLVTYAIKTENKSLIKRLGYLIETLGLNTEDLTKHIDNNYTPLDWNGTRKGEKNKKWKIIINRSLNDTT